MEPNGLQTLNGMPLESLYRLTLALGLGLFVGLEREWSGKTAGLRTFGFTALIGAMGGLLGESYTLTSLGLVGILITFLNIQSLKTSNTTELTTSAALMITNLAGILSGTGHTIVPTAVAVTTAGLLTYKQHLSGFSHKLTAAELRAAILLAILTFAIYPTLPRTAVDPWGLISPWEAWTTVILISAIGFVNYLLWKVYGQKGIELTGFLGGLVNSTVAVTELATRTRDIGATVIESSYRGVLLATIAMVTRNGILLFLLAPRAFHASLVPLICVLTVCGFSVRYSLYNSRKKQKVQQAPPLPLTSPFSLQAALKFGVLFLAIHTIGVLAQRSLGYAGFYIVSIVGGLISSASAVASAGSLAKQGQISIGAAGLGSILASLSSAAVNLVIVGRYANNHRLVIQLAKPLVGSLILAVLGATIQNFFYPLFD